MSIKIYVPNYAFKTPFFRKLDSTILGPDHLSVWFYLVLALQKELMGNLITENLWRRGELSYKLHGNQLEIYRTMRESTDKKTVILASRRFGKSYLSAVFAIEEGIRNPDSKIILLAPDTKQAMGIYSPIIKEISKDAPKGFIRPQKSEDKWFVGQSELVFAGFDTIAESLRGRGTILIIIDEAGFVNGDQFDYITKSILYPMLQKTIGKAQGRQIYISTPAKTPDHPFNHMWEQAKSEDKLKIYTIYDNPVLTDADILEIIKEQGGIDSVGFRREYLCENVRDTGGLIVPKFDRRHIIASVECLALCSDKWIVGDMGGVRDKSVIIVMGRSVIDDSIIIIDEYKFEPNTDVVEVGRLIMILKNKYQVKSHYIWMDAHGQTLVDLLHMCGISATLPPKQDRDGAIAALNAAFYRDEIFVAKNCPFTAESLLNCAFNDRRTDFLRSEQWGHADAIMAVVYGYRVAQFVITPKLYTHGIVQGNQMNFRQSGNLYGNVTKAMKPSKLVWNR